VAKRQMEVPVWVSLDASSGEPLHRQLYDRLRSGILAGQLSAGARLPSTRTLAAELGVSRTTVVTAFENLLAEGYLERKVGSGTYVARQEALIEEISQHLFGLLDASPAESGMHLAGWLPAGTDDKRASRRAAQQGVEAPPISLYTTHENVREGLMLGYAAVDEARTREGVRRLAGALE
jgi:DNA-binding transcriptional MocR family regulator